MADQDVVRWSCAVSGATNEELTRHLLAGSATIFTLNIAHLERLAHDDEFCESYGGASFVTLDSNCLNRFFLQGRMAVATGSDLVRHLCRRASLAGRSVLIIGNLSQAEAEQVLPARTIELVHPGWGFIHDDREVERIVSCCLKSDPDILFIAVGAPQSEKLALRLRRAGLSRASVLCCGASFNFELNTERRSPEFLQRLGLEWTWRLMGQPRRLAGRYLRAAAFIFRSLKQLSVLASTRHLRVGALDIEFRDRGTVAKLAPDAQALT